MAGPCATFAPLGGGQPAECYAINGRNTQSVRVNFVASIDGAATDHGLSGGLSGHADKRIFDLLRRLADVILVGAGTARAEGYGATRLDPASVQHARRVREARAAAGTLRSGPTLFGTLLDADRVDELCLTISPLLEAGGARRIVADAPEKARRMMLHHVLVSDRTLMLRYLRAAE